jgi:hypothetical protein
MAFDVEAAKAAGYTDAEISAYLQAKPETKEMAPVAPGQETDPGEPPPPPGAENYEQAGAGNYLPGLATGVMGAAAVGVPAAIGYGIKAGLSGAVNKGAQVMDVAKQGVAALQQQAQTAAQTEQRLQNRKGFGGNPATTAAAVTQAETAQAMANPTTQNYLQRMSAMASRYAPVAGKIAGMAGPATAMAMNLFGTSPEEIATLKAAEERRRQAAMMQQPR